MEFLSLVEFRGVFLFHPIKQVTLGPSISVLCRQNSTNYLLAKKYCLRVKISGKMTTVAMLSGCFHWVMVDVADAWLTVPVSLGIGQSFIPEFCLWVCYCQAETNYITVLTPGTMSR